MKFPKPIREIEGGCIIIDDGVTTQDGYRALRVDGQQWVAHRLSYSLNIREIPRSPATLKEGLVLHHCDNPPCINPDHLYLGSMQQNVIDKINRNHDWRSRVGRFNKGKLRSCDFKKAQAERMKGNSLRKGKTLSEDHRDSISSALKGNQFFKGKRHSDETRSKMKESSKLAWARRKQHAGLPV